MGAAHQSLGPGAAHIDAARMDVAHGLPAQTQLTQLAAHGDWTVEGLTAGRQTLVEWSAELQQFKTLTH